MQGVYHRQLRSTAAARPSQQIGAFLLLAALASHLPLTKNREKPTALFVVARRKKCLTPLVSGLVRRVATQSSSSRKKVEKVSFDRRHGGDKISSIVWFVRGRESFVEIFV